MYRPSLANLPLQMSLYYNSLFSLLFAVVIGACSLTKNLYYNKRVSISVIIIWAFLEPIRLYYGWSGNLQERVRQPLQLLPSYGSSIFRFDRHRCPSCRLTSC